MAINQTKLVLENSLTPVGDVMAKKKKRKKFERADFNISAVESVSQRSPCSLCIFGKLPLLKIALRKITPKQGLEQYKSPYVEL